MTRPSSPQVLGILETGINDFAIPLTMELNPGKFTKRRTRAPLPTGVSHGMVTVPTPVESTQVTLALTGEEAKIARKAAGLNWVGFHDLRHYFCSICVMAGIDFMTIAAWLGHKDGGILVGKVYGHLLDEHRRKAANRISFA